MGLFNKKKKSIDLSNITDYSSLNPNVLFGAIGDVGRELWEVLKEGQNNSVDYYSSYKRFKQDLDAKYPIDYSRRIVVPNETITSLRLTVGKCLYLLLAGINTDVYVSIDDDSEPVLLDEDTIFCEFTSALKENEIHYYQALRKYLSSNIVSIVNDTSNLLYGIDFCEGELPINTKECVEYHRFIELEEYNQPNNPNRKWTRVKSAPLFTKCYSINKANPVLLTSLEFLDVLVLDYICFATIAAPTRDLDKVLNVPYKGTTVKKMIEQKFGAGVNQYIENVICDLNCLPFRSFARMGLKIE